MTAGHLFRLLHDRQRFAQLAFAVQNFAVYGCGNDTAVVAGQRQFIKGHHRQALGFVLIAGVDRHLGTKGVEITVHGGVHFCIHLLLGARQQGIDFAIAVLALHQPGLQKNQTRVFQQV